MKLVLLSGGSGKRLWPLSNDSRSKQFLRVLEGQDGAAESMVERVWRQLGSAGLRESAYVATNRAQREMIASQLGPDVPVIVEPERRDTFPAMALAASYLYSEENVSLDTVVAVMPVDPYVDDAFFGHVRKLENVLRETGANLALIGVVPSLPSEKYGYIVPSGSAASSAEALRVGHFREKPSREAAEALMAEGALWNCGVFAFRLGYLIGLLSDKGYPIRYGKLLESYAELPKISFDYEVVERETKTVVLPYDGYWKDLGTWNTLTEEIGSPIIGRGLVAEDAENTHLINELDIPVAVLGARDLVVAASPDGILVTTKDASPRIKDVLGGDNPRPMFEERRWGQYKVVDYVKYPEGYEVLTKRIHIRSGCNVSYQLHRKRNEVWTIVSGIADIVLNERPYHVKPGDVVRVPEGTRHSIKGVTDVELIEVQTGQELIEEDIVRLCMEWDEIPFHQFI
ncbi:sugar phosphate nucleotidyltransferase [Cohnella thermotolerans]|uniref:sugar phosphate nucleotidyltransferase n=1 Tax=Cohnella thermotolerans TaxID=329858 RepID=UPI000411FD46|nr:sugar phosphate nucleotidyltransferase [Cohnella thermotolerans]